MYILPNERSVEMKGDLMSADGTKELIISTALDMFSKKGYSAVSTRDISGAVGIRTSSIYYYFKSKQDIFDALIQMADAMTTELKGVFFNALGSTTEVRCEDFVMAGRLFVTGYLQNEKIGPLLQTLESERFHDENANEIWTKMLFTAPLEHETMVFKTLYERGIIKEKDAAKLASEYQAIVMLGYFTNDIERLEASLTDFYKKVF